MNDKSYKDWYSMSDKALMEIIGSFVKHHRLNQNRSQAELSEAAGMSRSTLSLLERGELTTVGSLIQVLRALDLLYIMQAFEVGEELSPMEYLKFKGKVRKRSRKKAQKTQGEQTEW